MTGPLSGVRVIELRGIGPAPHCAMLLADMGAEVVRVDRPGGADIGAKRPVELTPALRSRTTVTLDLKSEDGREKFLSLVEHADAVIDPYRPGVLEKLGIDPATCWERNAALVVARVTGWGQEGPLSQTAGHDLNYLAVSGVLDAVGREGQPPAVPLNLVADYGGGSLYLAVGILAALLEARTSGEGQVIDVSMVDGVASLASLYYVLSQHGSWRPRGENYLDSGAPYYDSYECADGRYLSIAAIEDRFYRLAIGGLGLDARELPDRSDPRNWDRLREVIAARVRTRTRDEWANDFAGTDACVFPVLSFAEALNHPHARARKSFVSLHGYKQPAPAPRFSRTESAAPHPMVFVDEQETDAFIARWVRERQI